MIAQMNLNYLKLEEKQCPDKFLKALDSFMIRNVVAFDNSSDVGKILAKKISHTGSIVNFKRMSEELDRSKSERDEIYQIVSYCQSLPLYGTNLYWVDNVRKNSGFDFPKSMWLSISMNTIKILHPESMSILLVMPLFQSSLSYYPNAIIISCPSVFDELSRSDGKQRSDHIRLTVTNSNSIQTIVSHYQIKLGMKCVL